MRLFLVGAAILISSLSFAGPTVRVTSSGNCGTVEDNLFKGKDGTSLSLFLPDFSATTSGSYRNAQRTCYVNAQLTIPAGKQMRTVSAAADGQVFTSSQGYGSVSIDYSFNGESVDGYRQFGANHDGPWQVATSRDDSQFTRCSDRPTVVNISGAVKLRASRHSNDNQDSEVRLENKVIKVNAGHANSSISWNWSWKKCGDASPVFHGNFQSSYQAYNKQTYSASVFITGDHGFYNSSAGFRGNLYGIKHLGNRVFDGQWNVHGKTGWFKFTLSEDGNSFKGIWGDHSGTQGSWNGHR